MNNIILIICLILMSVVTSGCGQNRQYENYNLSSSDSIVLTAENHPHGYGKKTCFNCHVKSNIHYADRTGTGLAAAARPLVEADGINACPQCHRNNGVTE